MAATKTRLAKTTAANATLDKDNAGLKRAVEEAVKGGEANQRMVRREVEGLRGELSALWDRMDRQSSEQKSQLDDKNSTLLEFEDVVTNMENEINKKADRIKALQDQLRREKTQNEELDRQMSSLNEQVTTLAHKNSSMNLSQKQQHEQQHRNECDDLARTISELRLKLESIKSDTLSKELTIQDLNSTVTNLTEINHSKDGETARISQQHKTVAKELQVTVAKLDDARRDRELVCVKLEVTRREIEDLKVTANTQQSVHQRDNQQVIDANEELAKLKSASAELLVEKEQIKVKCKSYAKKVETLGNTCDRLETALTKVAAERDEACALTDELKQDRESILKIRDEETNHFQQAMGYFRDELAGISENQHAHETLSREFSSDTSELRKVIANLRKEKINFKETLSELGSTAQTLQRDPMSPFNVNRGFRTPTKQGGAHTTVSAMEGYENTIERLQVRRPH